MNRRLTRRQSLIAGSLGLTGLSLAELSLLRAASKVGPAIRAGQDGSATSPIGPARIAGPTPRANSCVFIFLFGGPSHIDLWDMKPHAPAEIRGEFQPVATNVPGIHLCEHLPLLAQQMEKFCLLRSMTHKMNVHGPACSELYSGREYFGPPVTDQALPQDWPSVASLVTRFGPRRDGLPPSVVLPWHTQFVGQDKRIAGQTGGRMGDEFNPFLVEGDPSQAAFKLHGLEPLPGLSTDRLARRRELQSLLQAASEVGPAIRAGRGGDVADRSRPARIAGPTLYDEHVATAWETLSRAQSAGAFDISQEPQTMRDKYGWTKFGQSLLAARRLVEAGVPLVTVNWDDDSRSDKVSPFWDTHHHNFSKLKDGLCPIFDRAFAAFVEDLHDRWLLDTTFVAALGEFGRTPRIGLITQNGMTEKTGRDHWPHAFTALLAGGGVRGGQAYGETNATGGYVADRPVTPADLAATILTHLGIDPHLEYDDRFQRMMQRLSEGRAIRGLG